jgi:hypothetical protein
VTDGFKRAAMLERQRGHDGGILRIGFGSAPNLGAVDENLCDPAILKPANAARIALAITLEPVQPVLAGGSGAVGERLARSCF